MACSCNGQFALGRTVAIRHYLEVLQADLLLIKNETMFSNHLDCGIIYLHRMCLLPCRLFITFKLIPQGLPPVDGLGVLHGEMKKGEKLELSTEDTIWFPYKTDNPFPFLLPFKVTRRNQCFSIRVIIKTYY